MPETRKRVYITVNYGGEEVYSECSINELDQDEMYLLMPDLLKNAGNWLKECVKERIEQIQNPAYAHQQTSLPISEEEE